MEKFKPKLQKKNTSKTQGKRIKLSKDIENKALAYLEALKMPTNKRATDEQLEALYEKGYLLYNAGKYKEASLYFHMLNFTKIGEVRWIMAIAACHQMMKQYVEAIQYYMLAAAQDPDNPYPQYYLADCLIKTDSLIGALIALEVGHQRCQKNLAEYQSLDDRIMSIKAPIEKELKARKELSRA